MNLILARYFVIFIIVFFLFYYIPLRHRRILLLFSSVLFYIADVPSYIAVPAFIIAVSYGAGILMEKANRPYKKKAIFITGLIANIGALIFFKYTGFNLLIPLGVSYITFQAVGYTIEIFRGRQIAEKKPWAFATYLMFFPKIICGPIERAHHFLPQLHAKNEFNYRQCTDGLKLIAWGLFKKFVIADRLSMYSDDMFAKPDLYTGSALIIPALLFTIRLYADFSAYTDIAIGSARALGFELMRNFDYPFIAKSTTELWRRWHISLSTWFYEYVFNPIAMAWRERGKWAVVYASLVTFLILGLWHGGTLNFAVFGLLQGIVLSAEFLTRKPRKALRGAFPKIFSDIFGVLFTFVIFSFALIFFKAENFSGAIYIVGHLFDFSNEGHKICSFLSMYNKSQIIHGAVLIIFMFTVEYLNRNYNLKNFIASRPAYQRWTVYYLFVCFLVMDGLITEAQFIYFKF